MADQWNVFRCQACKICHGRKSTGHNCPHCGQRINQDCTVVDKAANPEELRLKVILHNTPEELRDLLQAKLLQSDGIIKSSKSYSPQRAYEYMRNNFPKEFSRTEIDNMFSVNQWNNNIEEFISSAESQGLIIRLHGGKWEILE